MSILQDILKRLISFFLLEKQGNEAVLLRSNIEYCDSQAYVSLVFNDGQRVLKATEIKKISFCKRTDSYLFLASENKTNESKRISKKCKDEIEKLQLLLDEIISYEST